MVTKKNLWRNYAPKNSSFSLKSSNFVTRHENHHVTKLADWYGNSVTREMHKKVGPGGWQRSKIDCQQLGPEFRQPLKIWDHIKDIQRKKLIYAKIVSKLGDLTVPGTYLFIKNLFEREKLVLFSLKIKNLKKTKKTQKNPLLVGFLGGFFRWVFWVGFFGWIF